MAEPRLVVDDTYTRDGKYQLAWYFPDEGEIGGVLGESWSTNKDTKREDVNVDELETWVLEHTVAALADEIRPSGGFFFESRSGATTALRVAKAALRAARADKPLEEWEQKALAAGWKPPTSRTKK